MEQGKQLPQVKEKRVPALILCCTFIEQWSTIGSASLRDITLGWRQDNGNWSNQESKFDFLATRQCLGRDNKK